MIKLFTFTVARYNFCKNTICFSKELFIEHHKQFYIDWCFMHDRKPIWKCMARLFAKMVTMF